MVKNDLHKQEITKDETLLQKPQEENALDLIPAKFKDTDGTVNVVELVKSYLALEKKLGSRDPKTIIPDSPDDYQLTAPNDLIRIDPALNAQLHALGFTNAQAQAVYDIAAEKVLPLLQEMSLELKNGAEMKELEQAFGGPEQFATIARQISAWGEKHLDRSLFETLAGTKDGILIMHQMMQRGQEQTVLDKTSKIDAPLSEGDLRKLMADPKYWKDRDPDLTKRIEDGFKRLYD